MDSIITYAKELQLRADPRVDDVLARTEKLNLIEQSQVRDIMTSSEVRIIDSKDSLGTISKLLHQID